MKTKKKLSKVHCGDWHRSWGFSGARIGTLHATDKPNEFVWKGHMQGRHGQKWNKGQEVLVKVDLDERKVLETKEIKEGSRLPDLRDVWTAIDELNGVEL